jgi:hypothetical protein
MRGLSRPAETPLPRIDAKRAQNAQFFDLLAEDSRLNVYADELEVRPPGAPTTEGVRRSVSLSEAELQANSG